MEVWKDIKGYEGYYQVSNLGRVKSLSREVYHPRGNLNIKGRLLKTALGGKGYEFVVLSKDKKQKPSNIHSLVAIHFLDHIPDGHKKIIDHKNNIKTDNRVENLQIITNRDNSSKDKKGFSSRYIGVSWASHMKKWLSNIRINGKSVHLGYFNDEYKAHLAYQNKLKEINAKEPTR